VEVSGQNLRVEASGQNLRVEARGQNLRVETLCQCPFMSINSNNFVFMDVNFRDISFRDVRQKRIQTICSHFMVESVAVALDNG